MTVTVGLFIVTIFSLVATLFGDPQAPVAQFFTRYGGWMIGIEVVAFLIVGFLALTVDRRQSLREWQAYEARQLAKFQRKADASPQTLQDTPESPPTNTP